MHNRFRSAALAVGALTLVVGSALALAETPQALGSVTPLPDHSGTLVWIGRGDGGGRMEIRYMFKGFYMWSAGEQLRLFPMTTTVSINGGVSRSTTFEKPPSRTDCWTSTHTVATQWIERAPSEADMTAVLLHNAPPPPGFVLPPHFAISDRRASGGPVELTAFQFTSPLAGPEIPLQATFIDYDSPGDVDRSQSGAGSFSYMLSLHDRPVLAPKADIGYTGSSLPPSSAFWFESQGPIALSDDFDMASPRLLGTVSARTAPGNPKCSYLQTDETFQFDVQWNIGIQQKVDATIEPTFTNEADWMPDYNQIREYKITLNDPGPEGVGGLRVSLVGTSAHPGIATNARNHNQQAPVCHDCTRSLARQTHSDTQDFHGVTVTRHYHGFNACPIDDLPDMYFIEAENPGFTLVDPITAELKQPISQVIELADTTESTYLVSVMVKDSAASARLIAEVEIGGSWVPVKAIGPTADPLGTELLLPLDRDDDGMADRWETLHNASDPAGDTENIPGAVNTGDGLTNFEEYRGLYALGQFVRTDPEQKTIFVHDYTGRRLPEIHAMRDFYAPKGLQVYAVDGSEFFQDVVNYQRTDATRGDQYIAVLMENPATPAGVGYRAFADDWLTFAGKASHLGPPQKGLNTMALQYRIELRSYVPWQTIGHELGHLMNVQHHGAGDGLIDTPDGVGYAALAGGQHSGDFNCIMKYEVATQFCTFPRMMRYNTWFFEPYPLQVSRQATSLCMDKTGTGTNAAGAWAGNATHGNCTAQVKVRSY